MAVTTFHCEPCTNACCECCGGKNLCGTPGACPPEHLYVQFTGIEYAVDPSVSRPVCDPMTGTGEEGLPTISYEGLSPYAPRDLSWLVGLTLRFTRIVGGDCGDYLFSGYSNGAGGFNPPLDAPSLSEAHVERVYLKKQSEYYAGLIPPHVGGTGIDGLADGPCGRRPEMCGCPDSTPPILPCAAYPLTDTPFTFCGIAFAAPLPAYSATIFDVLRPRACPCFDPATGAPNPPCFQTGVRIGMGFREIADTSTLLNPLAQCDCWGSGYGDNDLGLPNVRLGGQSCGQCYAVDLDGDSVPDTGPTGSLDYSKITMGEVVCDGPVFVSQDFEWYVNHKALVALRGDAAQFDHYGEFALTGVVFA